MCKPFHVGMSLLLWMPVLGLAQQESPHAASDAPPAAALSSPTSTAEGMIKLDVMVTDKSGNSVAGLEPKDFTLLDNSTPAKIVSFQAFDERSRPDPPVEVILVIDTLNTPSEKSFLAERAVQQFLRQNNGHLAQPISIYLLSSTGLSSTPQPVTDGNALADAIARGRDLPILRQSPAFRLGQTYAENGQIVRMTAGGIANRSSVKALGSIAIEERRKPGRKLLFWLGPGWPAAGLGGDVSFETITELSTRLREARISLWNVREWADPNTRLSYLDFLAPLRSGERVQPGNMALAVLAIQSGGGVLETIGDLDGAIRKCIENESVFYTLTFDPPITDQVDDYRDLKVVVSKPDLISLTNTGYYNQPAYHDHPSQAKRLTVEQLEQMLEAAHSSGDKELSQQLSGVELTERMTSTKLSSWKIRLPGERSRAALVALADRSAFLSLPASDIPTTAPPDFATRRQMLSRTIDYLSKTIVKLPDFFATRTTVQYSQPPKKYGETWKSATGEQWLHVTETSNTTVSFRDGKEVVDAKAVAKTNRYTRELNTQGTFGPILAMVFGGAAAARSQFSWLHWEQGTDGPKAVFRYAIPQDVSHFEVGFCCLADPDGTIFFRKKVAYHGEVMIDPVTGAILRLTVVADLEPRLPMLSSAIMVEYGPVMIGAKTYICPTRSVSISRQRTVEILNEWGESFGVYGRFEAILNDATFEKYHLFRAESRILPGYTEPPNQK